MPPKRYEKTLYLKFFLNDVLQSVRDEAGLGQYKEPNRMEGEVGNVKWEVLGISLNVSITEIKLTTRKEIKSFKILPASFIRCIELIKQEAEEAAAARRKQEDDVDVSETESVD